MCVNVAGAREGTLNEGAGRVKSERPGAAGTRQLLDELFGRGG